MYETHKIYAVESCESFGFVNSFFFSRTFTNTNSSRVSSYVIMGKTRDGKRRKLGTLQLRSRKHKDWAFPAVKIVCVCNTKCNKSDAHGTR